MDEQPEGKPTIANIRDPIHISVRKPYEAANTAITNILKFTLKIQRIIAKFTQESKRRYQ